MKNLIFDMGGVLIRYDPEYFLTREGVLDPFDREMLITVWVRLGICFNFG